jgi:hypothetical protein
MTDYERRELIDKLRCPGSTVKTALRLSDCQKAADELERLAAQNKEYADSLYDAVQKAAQKGVLI